ncbi:hypothetical protein OQX61_02655 [Pedobacter sp. PLR]|uniref:hypothetical protein n=1 Tax=Pedobacter sp. PLR TaxID=2994465 RepID=UPI002247A893|nr:hypothetical protein [Pedobacter sp. PLR]MCX2450161.1 hypothetical protein [Pedobacter sp. PLR]
MRKIYERRNNTNRLGAVIFSLLILFCSSCSKKNQEPEEVIKTEIYSYEVTCTACEIQFMDTNKSIKKITNTNGKWSYSFEKADAVDLKINIRTTNSVYQSIDAYILKNNEVIYGGLGYNSFDLLYNVNSGQKSMIYGSYSAGSSGGSGSSGGNTKPTSSVCGAKNKTGGYCKRVVSGGGRCWQHS